MPVALVPLLALGDLSPAALLGGAGAVVLAAIALVLWRGRGTPAATLAPRGSGRTAGRGAADARRPRPPEDAERRASGAAAADEPAPAPARRPRRPSDAPVLIELRDVARAYVDAAGETVLAVQNASLRVREGELLGIIGPSGQGKSTLLNVIGGLDSPTSGDVLVRGEPLPRGESEALRRYRAEQISFVFQDLNLVTHLTAEENAALPLVCRGVARKEALARARHNLGLLGLGDLLHRRPSQLSGGQKQRVAIARAFTSPAPIVLADEPTGSLDPRTAREVMDAFHELCKLGGGGRRRTVVLVTHNTSLARRYCDRVVRCTTDGLVEVEDGAHERDDDAPLRVVPGGRA